MIIKHATREDLPHIYTLSNQINAQHHQHLPDDFAEPSHDQRDAPYWVPFLEDDDSTILIAQRDKAIVGVICAKLVLNKSVPFLVHKKRCFIGTIVVAEKQQGSGIGKQLMQAIEQWALHNNAVEIMLEVMRFNDSAKQFYQSLAYREFSTKMSKKL